MAAGSAGRLAGRVRGAAACHITADGRVTILRSQAPVLLRYRPGVLHLVAGAGGPLGGDETTLDLQVDGQLDVRSAAASLAQPGARPGASRQHVTACVSGALDWAPEPLVVTAGAHHVVQVSVNMAAGACLRWREVIVLGRHKETPGRLDLITDVRRDGRPVLLQESSWGPGGQPGWDGPAGLGGARVVLTELVVGLPVRDGPGVLRLADDVALRLVRGGDAVAVLAAPCPA